MTNITDLKVEHKFKVGQKVFCPETKDTVKIIEIEGPYLIDETGFHIEHTAYTVENLNGGHHYLCTEDDLKELPNG